MIDPHNLLPHVEPDLVKVVMACSQAHPFIVVQGLRTPEQEAGYVKSGASETMHSRHLPDKNGLAAAIDFAAIVDGHVSWDGADYLPIVAAMKESAADLGIPIECGADWHMRDMGHVQLPWAQYP